jgi:hypothetical protein
MWEIQQSDFIKIWSILLTDICLNNCFIQLNGFCFIFTRMKFLCKYKKKYFSENKLLKNEVFIAQQQK